MNKEINKIISWIEMSYTRLNYKEELSLVDYIKQLQQENKQLKDNWNKLKEWTKKAVDKYYDCDLRVEMIYKNVLNKMEVLDILKEVE